MQFPFGPWTNLTKSCYIFGMTHNLTGQRFGALTVSSLHDKKGKNRRWLCQCDCGGISYSTTTNLRSGNSTACGNCRVGKSEPVTHGAATKGKTRTYLTWKSMRYRVRHKPEYSGIDIDPAWMDFAKFLDDMGERPEGMTIDRIDNDLGYSKANCRWATPTQQTRNRRISRTYTDADGITMYLADWAAALGITYNAVLYRLKQYGSVRIPYAI